MRRDPTALNPSPSQSAQRLKPKQVLKWLVFVIAAVLYYLNELLGLFEFKGLTALKVEALSVSSLYPEYSSCTGLQHAKLESR